MSLFNFALWTTKAWSSAGPRLPEEAGSPRGKQGYEYQRPGFRLRGQERRRQWERLGRGRGGREAAAAAAAARGRRPRQPAAQQSQGRGPPLRRPGLGAKAADTQKPLVQFTQPGSDPEKELLVIPNELIPRELNNNSPPSRAYR